MRVLPEGLMENMHGSLSSGYMEFTCWYDGRPVISSLPISGWSQTFSGGTQISGSTNITVEDESGDLAPWGVDEPLGVGGSILQTRLILDSDSLNLGWQRISTSTPQEVWRRGPQGLIWVNGGSTIEVEASDMTIMVSGNKFITPESPQAGNTCIQEIRRLMLGNMDVTFESNVEDVLIPPSITYRDERLDAIEDLIAALGCSYRVTGTGQMSVYKPNKTSVWTVKAGDLGGSLISIARSQDISSLKNFIVARATLDGGEELQAAASEESGPLRVDGPHGRWPEMIQADLAKTMPDMERAAESGLDSVLRSRVISLPLTTVFHPGLELGDWITVMCPMNTGEEIPLEGRVSSISYSGPAMPLSMSITVEADLYSVQALSEALRARRWTR